MIIDFRVRPPFRSFLNLVIHQDWRLAQFQRMNGMTPARSAVEHSADFLVAELDAAAVDVAVVVGRNTPTRGAVDNADIASFIARDTSRFVGIGGIDVSDGATALQEYRRCIDTLGLTGVAMCAGFSEPARHVDDPEIFPLYEACQADGVPVVFTYSSQTGPDLEYSNPVHLDRVAGRFPKLRMVVAHAAWPWVTHMIAVALKHPNIAISPDWFAFGIPGVEQYTAAADTFLQQQYIFGSSYPLRPVGPTVEAFLELPMRPETRQHAQWQNAADLLLACQQVPDGVRQRLRSARAEVR